MSSHLITGLSTEVLLSQVELDALSESGAMPVIKRALRILAIIPDGKVPWLAVYAKSALEIIELTTQSSGMGVEELCRAVILDLSFHERTLNELNKQLKLVFEWMTTVGAAITVQAARATESVAADEAKKRRIARIIISGAGQWPSDSQEAEQVKTQQMSEFTRIATILLDIDVHVLRAIHIGQVGLISTYRAAMNAEPGSDRRAQLQDEWRTAVFQVWKDTELNSGVVTFGFLDLLSAVTRLEAQGLICRPSTQVVQARDISSTPFGLTDLGAQFVEMSLG